MREDSIIGRHHSVQVRYILYFIHVSYPPLGTGPPPTQPGETSFQTGGGSKIPGQFSGFSHSKFRFPRFGFSPREQIIVGYQLVKYCSMVQCKKCAALKSFYNNSTVQYVYENGIKKSTCSGYTIYIAIGTIALYVAYNSPGESLTLQFR